MKKNNFTIEKISRIEVAGEVPDAQWKEKMIRRIRFQESLRHVVDIFFSFRMAATTGVVFSGLFLLFSIYTHATKQPVTIKESSTFPVATEWEKEHVRFVFAETMDFPDQFPDIEFIKKSIDRIATDQIAFQLYPPFLENSVEENEQFISYQANGRKLFFYKQDGYMEYTLFEPSSPQDFDRYHKKNLQIMKKKKLYAQYQQKQKIVVDETIQQLEPFLFSGKKYFVKDEKFTKIVQIMIDDHIRYDAFSIQFYGDKPYKIISPLIIDAKQIGIEKHLSQNTILDYINQNPAIPELPIEESEDFFIEYEVRDYTIDPKQIVLSVFPTDETTKKVKEKVPSFFIAIDSDEIEKMEDWIVKELLQNAINNFTS